MSSEVETYKPKSFWIRPEGKVGAAVLVTAGAALGIFHNPVLDFLRSMFDTPFTTMGIFAVLGTVALIFTDSRARKLVGFAFKGLMRKIAGLFVQLDPIKILESYIDYLKKNRDEMNTNIQKLRGQLSKLHSIVTQNQNEMDQKIRIARQAKLQNRTELVAINTRQYGRLKELNGKYETMIGKMNVLYNVLTKIYTSTAYMIQDTENEVRLRKQEAAAIMSGYSAMQHAMNIINGDPDRKMMFDMANEALADDIYAKIGEMDTFIELSGDFIDNVNIQNAAFEQQGNDLIAKLEKMEREGLSYLESTAQLPQGDVKPMTASEIDAAIRNKGEKIPAGAPRDFTNIYNH